jgi:hypothetical protein
MLFSHNIVQIPNPSRDPTLEGVNSIRRSLRLMTGNNTAYSLRQPHIDRTREWSHLCIGE